MNGDDKPSGSESAGRETKRTAATENYRVIHTCLERLVGGGRVSERTDVREGRAEFDWVRDAGRRVVS